MIEPSIDRFQHVLFVLVWHYLLLPKRIHAALTVNSVLAGWVPHDCPHLRPLHTPLTPLPSTLTSSPCIPFIRSKRSSQNTDSLAKEVSPNQRILGNELNCIQTLFMYAMY